MKGEYKDLVDGDYYQISDCQLKQSDPNCQCLACTDPTKHQTIMTLKDHHAKAKSLLAFWKDTKNRKWHEKQCNTLEKCINDEVFTPIVETMPIDDRKTRMQVIIAQPNKQLILEHLIQICSKHVEELWLGFNYSGHGA